VPGIYLGAWEHSQAPVFCENGTGKVGRASGIGHHVPVPPSGCVVLRQQVRKIMKTNWRHICMFYMAHAVAGLD